MIGLEFRSQATLRERCQALPIEDVGNSVLLSFTTGLANHRHGLRRGS